MTKIDIAALSNHPVFLGTAKAETMLRDFDRHRMAVRDHDSEAAEKTWDMCERWVDQLKPLTEGDVRTAILSLAAEKERLRAALIWCGGSSDFSEGGTAREGWLKVCMPLLGGSGQK